MIRGMTALAVSLVATAMSAGAATEPETGSKERVIAALSQHRVSITADFSGSEIFVYGAIERDRFPNESDDGADIIVAVTGPSNPIVMHRKARILGIWANAESVRIAEAPSFYALATSSPVEEILAPSADARHRITIESAISIPELDDEPGRKAAYREAAIRVNRTRGVYFERPGGVEIEGKTLFQTRIKLPANIVEGDYRARVFLLRGGHVVDNYETAIGVRKVGLERWIYTLAQEQSFLYGVMSILVALVAGWSASTVFRLINR